MDSHQTRRPSSGLIVAMIALVVALAGTAQALPGHGKVDKNDIKRNAVKSKAIKAAAVTTDKLADGAVTSAKLADGSVTTNKLAGSAVTGGKLADGAVSTDKLADASVTNAKLADAAVSTGKLADASVTSAKLAPDSVNSSKVVDESINANDLGPGIVTTVAFGKIVNDDPGTPQIASGSVGLQSVAIDSGSADGDGRLDLTVSADVLGPTASLAQCIAQATPAADVAPNASLGYGTVTVAMPEGARVIETQTRGAGEGLADFDYYIEVICPNI